MGLSSRPPFLHIKPPTVLIHFNIMPLAEAMGPEERAKELPPVLARGWSIVPGREAIQKKFEFNTLNEAWQFMSAVALFAEQHVHHPEWTNNWKTVDVIFCTHDDKALSIRDVLMAGHCDDVFKRFSG